MNRLPTMLYTAARVRELDRIAIEDHHIPGSTLMARAAQAAFKLMSTKFADAKKIAVVCGMGNNAGDGFVLARIAQPLGFDVTVILVGNPDDFKGDCLEAYANLQGTKAIIKKFENDNLSPYDLVVDALFGSGLSRPIEGRYKDAVDCINGAGKPVLAIDIPSGINADTGEVMGVAVRACATISFIGLKQGLFTGKGLEHAGEIHFSDLGVPAAIFNSVTSAVSLLDLSTLLKKLPQRARDTHKGDFGHTLVVGGDAGMTGAARLACEGALRVGSGLVSLATREKHAALVNIGRPEIMSHGVEKPSDLGKRLSLATVVAVGPGIGRGRFAEIMWRGCLKSALPLVVDADALNLLARDPVIRGDWILTPHPGEAARLLGCTTADVQRDRFAAVCELQKKYAAVVVLKGCGTLVCDGGKTVGVCDKGNPGMASGGMGDALTGIIAGLVSQGVSLIDAAQLGVCLHATAADMAAREGERGLLAGDIFAHVRKMVNGLT
ncbi:MAG: NAD(P)H-hydrate dehydratase [Deltaproteobacteria bacterium]|nr:NAD(P)H-hydrate dehydratase [Deltaproteobacteria bacterium]